MAPRPQEERPAAGPPRSAEERTLRRAVVALCAVIFLADLLLRARASTGGLYTLPVLVSLWVRRSRYTLAIAGICTLLTLSAYVFALLGSGVDLFFEGADRAVALFAIWVTTYLGLLESATEGELVQSRETAATTLRSIADGVVTTDVGGLVTFLNRVAEDLTGWSGDEARGRPLEEVVRIEVELRPRPPGREGRALPPEATEQPMLVRRDGNALPIDQSRAAIVDSAGELHGHVVVLRDAGPRSQYEEAMGRVVWRDGLTGVSNRAALDERLELELAHARRDRSRLALLFLDLDDFKAVNDAHGHAAGDACLRGIAEAIAASLREVDTVARVGGDEFVVLLPGVADRGAAEMVAEKILERASGGIEWNGRSIRVTPSIGIALFPEDAETAPELLRLADRAMYGAKSSSGAASIAASSELAADG